MKARGILYSVLVLMIFSACNVTRHLEPGQNLYWGSQIKYQSTVPLSKSKKKDLTSQLQNLIRPKPNSRILGIPFKLWVHNLAPDTSVHHGLFHWLSRKFGEAPVLADMKTLNKNREVLQNYLENIGYFRDSVSLDTSVKKKKLTAIYTAMIDKQYTIRNVTFPIDSSALGKQIARITKRFSLLKTGNPYNLDVIKAERNRIDARLKERGFYYFNPDYLIANVDSTIGDHKVDIDMRVKPETPNEAREVYKIGDVVVFADYDINSDTSLAQAKEFAGYKIVDPKHKFQPKIFDRTLVFKPGDVYNRTDHNLSLNRLTSLDVFKFVKARFERTDTIPGNYLNALYYLTPGLSKSIRFTVSGLTKSNNAVGTEVSLNWRHRNLLKGAEHLDVRVYGGLEKQYSSGIDVSTRRLGVETNLYIPRIISPFKLRTSSEFVPQTKFSVGYEVFNRNTQYTLTSITGNYGYVWKQRITNEHQLNLISINYVKPENITDTFKQALDTNISLRRSIERQFIIGTNYNYNYNSQARQNYRKHNFYVNANVDLSGNLLGLITGASAKSGKVKEIFNTPFSQYTRLEGEVRHYMRLGNRYRSLNTRFLAGAAFAYGNSTNIPFIKSFFAGGTNDIRAFRARSLGPGAYYAGNPRDSFVAEQPGDIKLEMNIEYRAKLFSIVRWAAFIDAGNIWTKNDDTLRRPNSKFTSHFLDQTAVGVGLGLRFDINILVLRLDLAFPVRVPWRDPDDRWVFDEINFGSKEWRRQNLVWNLAIGYPF
jgi:outer membrane protein assembly factor BamA